MDMHILTGLRYPVGGFQLRARERSLELKGQVWARERDSRVNTRKSENRLSGEYLDIKY